MSELIYAKLAAVMAQVQAVAKNDRNDHQKFMFRGIDAVVNAVGPALREHQVIVVPQVTSVAYEDVQTSTGKPATACRVKVAYLFFAEDGSHIETSVVGEAWDAGDKATPKAMSVAFRTALLQALTLPTDEPDPDTHTYEQAPKAQPKVETSPKTLIVDRLNRAGVDKQVFADWLKSEHGVGRLDDLDDKVRLQVVDAVTKGDLLAQLRDAA